MEGVLHCRPWSDRLHRQAKDVDALGFGDLTSAAVAAISCKMVTTINKRRRDDF
jgi:hypothetical protein